MKPGRSMQDSDPAGALAVKKTATISLLGTWIGMLVVCALMLVSVAWYLSHTLLQQAQQLEQGQLDAQVTARAVQIEALLDKFTSNVHAISQDPSLAHALQSAGQQPEAVEQALKPLQFIFPNAARIDLLPVGTDEIDNSQVPPFGYACLDLMKKSQQNAATVTLMEAHLSGSKDGHIDFFQAVRDGNNQVLGSLLVTLSEKSMRDFFNHMPKVDGYIELWQPTAVKNIVLAHQGDAQLKQGQAAAIGGIANSDWKLAYWPAQAKQLLQFDWATYIASFAMAYAVLVVVFYVFYLRLTKVIRLDQVSVIREVKDILQGADLTHHPIHLASNRGLMEQLQQMARDEQRKGRRPASMKSGSAANKTSATVVAAGSESKPEEEVLGVTYASKTDALEVEELPEAEATAASANIFRAYDIRGIVGSSLTTDIVRNIGRAIGSQAEQQGQQTIVVARDGRLSGPELSVALIEGLKSTGREVVDIGQVPTPLLYFSAHYLGNGSGVVITGSHNPPEYNGLKIMLQGQTLHDESLQALKKRIDEAQYFAAEGSERVMDVLPSYIERICNDVRVIRPLKVVIDCGNGVAGVVAPQLYRALGCEVTELFCEVDGKFPNHHPDPSRPENLLALTKAIQQHGADVGLAFDGDGDRLGVVDSQGKIIWPDRLLMLLASDVLSRQPGAQIIYDVKSCRAMESYIAEKGGQPLLWKTGHSFIKAKMQETGALLAGEMSGHIFFKERWFGFDDALYAGARLLEVLAAESDASALVFATLPDSLSTPELTASLAEGQSETIMRTLLAEAPFTSANRQITLDGLRVEYDDGWGLVRASNTTPSLVFRFEADDAAALERIQEAFRKHLLTIEPSLELPF